MRCSSILFVLSILTLAGCAATQAPIAATGTPILAPAPAGITPPPTESSNARHPGSERGLPSGPIDALLNEVV